MGILSLLFWNLLPQIRLLETQGSARFEKIASDAGAVQFSRAVLSDFSRMRWAFWQRPPQVEQEEGETRFSWIDQKGEERSYALRAGEGFLEIRQDGEKRIYPVSGLKEFHMEEDEEGGADWLLRLTSSHREIRLPLRFGSRSPKAPGGSDQSDPDEEAGDEG